MAEHDRPQVGSVAEEASRLLDALGGWASTAGAAYAGSAPHDHVPPRAPGPDPVDEQSSPGGSRCESCGAENRAGRAVACQLCPVCQGIALLRSVRPETVDRMADLAGAVAATLRDLAEQRRAAPPSPGSPSGGARGDAGRRVHDIQVDGDDEEPGVAP